MPSCTVSLIPTYLPAHPHPLTCELPPLLDSCHAFRSYATARLCKLRCLCAYLGHHVSPSSVLTDRVLPGKGHDLPQHAVTWHGSCTNPCLTFLYPWPQCQQVRLIEGLQHLGADQPSAFPPLLPPFSLKGRHQLRCLVFFLFLPNQKQDCTAGSGERPGFVPFCLTPETSQLPCRFVP